VEYKLPPPPCPPPSRGRVWPACHCPARLASESVAGREGVKNGVSYTIKLTEDKAYKEGR